MDNGTLVEVYYNLNRKCLSVRLAGGRVIGYTERVALLNVRLVVGQRGREKVLATKHKNVHAYARGVITEWEESINTLDWGWQPVTYDPYLYTTFVVRGRGIPVNNSPYVRIEKRKVWAWLPNILPASLSAD